MVKTIQNLKKTSKCVKRYKFKVNSPFPCGSLVLLPRAPGINTMTGFLYCFLETPMNRYVYGYICVYVCVYDCVCI